MMKQFYTINNHEDYEISDEGKVRKVSTKKYKTLVSDKNGRKLVVLPLESGELECLYIQDILAEQFSSLALKTYLEESREEKLPDYEALMKKYKEALEKLENSSDGEMVVRKTNKRSKKLYCPQLDMHFNSYSEAARHFQVSYEKLYDSVYNKGEYKGHTFEVVK